MNIAEILKYCPRGTKLYSSAYGEVFFIRVVPLVNTIEVELSKAFSNNIEIFYNDGTLYRDGECVLFPSKEQRDWDKFRIPVKRGDIMMKIDGTYPFIATGEMCNDISPIYICGINTLGNFQIGFNEGGWTSGFYIPASKEAKKKLFNKMKEAGYRWNADTLELEKVESKFKEGDVIVDTDGNLFIFTGIIKDNKIQVPCVFVNGEFVNCGVSMNPSPISSLKLASEEDRNKVYSTLIKKGYKYDEEQHKLIKQNFIPFDKVLVKDDPNENWSINLFSYYDKEDEDFPYVCLSGRYHYCIPYEEHEYLVGKN